MRDINQGVFNQPHVAAYYGSLDEIDPCERHLFAAHLGKGGDILDIGAGGGRLAAELSAIAGRYVGIDYAPAMIARCRERHPDLDFRPGDACHLEFPDASFDACVFSANGIDYLHPDSRRLACFDEVNRVLKPGGVFIFSHHNARFLLVKPKLAGVSTPKAAWRILWCLGKNAALWARCLADGIYWRGEGYRRNVFYGSYLIHLCTLRRALEELEPRGFHLLEVVSSDFPDPMRQCLTPWYYYAFQKKDNDK